MNTTPTKVQIDAEFSSLRFATTQGSFAYGEGYLGSLHGDPKPISGIVSNGWSNWYIFYVADCYDPPIYAINANSFQDAYDEFLCEFEHLVKIDDADLEETKKMSTPAEYADRVTWNDNGTPVDAESVHGFEVQLVEAKR